MEGVEVLLGLDRAEEAVPLRRSVACKIVLLKRDNMHLNLKKCAKLTAEGVPHDGTPIVELDGGRAGRHVDPVQAACISFSPFLSLSLSLSLSISLSLTGGDEAASAAGEPACDPALDVVVGGDLFLEEVAYEGRVLCRRARQIVLDEPALQNRFFSLLT